MSFFQILAHPGAKTLDFGTPWRPAGALMAPQIAQVAPKGYPFLKRVAAISPTEFQDRFQSVPGHHLVDMGWIWDEF